MFRVRSTEFDRSVRVAVVAVLALSVAALLVTIWVMVDLTAEQKVVHSLIAELPADERGKAVSLEGELRWQFRLSMLIILNLVVTGIAVVLLSRAYRSSQESLRDIKALAGDILSSIDQGVVTTDLHGIVTSINRRGLEMLDPQVEAAGRPLGELSHAVPLNEFRCDWSVEKSVEMTRDFTAKINGSDRTLRAFCQMLYDIDEKEIGYVLQLRDVTDRLQIEERVRRMERYAGLGSLAAGLHHEIKNPLAALSLHVQLLEEQLEEEASKEVRQMLGVIRTEVNRVGGVLESFRDFASIDRLNLTPVCLKELIQQQVELVRPTAVQQGVTVEVQLDQHQGLKVHADRMRLEQVLLNLLVNALEAMPNGGHLTVAASMSGESAKITVTDSGVGIPVELHDKVFDAYFTTKATGTGLGLALSDKIMRQHDGTLHFRATENGTTFEMTLPLYSQTASRE